MKPLFFFSERDPGVQTRSCPPCSRGQRGNGRTLSCSQTSPWGHQVSRALGPAVHEQQNYQFHNKTGPVAGSRPSCDPLRETSQRRADGLLAALAGREQRCHPRPPCEWHRCETSGSFQASGCYYNTPVQTSSLCHLLEAASYVTKLIRGWSVSVLIAAFELGD